MDYPPVQGTHTLCVSDGCEHTGKNTTAVPLGLLREAEARRPGFTLGNEKRRGNIQPVLGWAMTLEDPTLTQLKNRLTRLLPSAGGFSAIGYRSSTPKYATENELLLGEGSKRHGGRWNPIGIAAVYASLTPETAMAETLAHNRYYGIAVEEAMPRTYECAWEGLIVPAAADRNGHNLLVFPGNLRTGSHIRVLHPDRLRE
jgi:RES domain-containing protein